MERGIGATYKRASCSYYGTYGYMIFNPDSFGVAAE